eukprot:5204435-Pyramimonas_sp.AAC.2
MCARRGPRTPARMPSSPIRTNHRGASGYIPAWGPITWEPVGIGEGDLPHRGGLQGTRPSYWAAGRTGLRASL